MSNDIKEIFKSLKRNEKPKYIGDIGEYYVATELTKRGYTVTMTRDGTPMIDLIVVKSDSKKTKYIQVKTTTNKENKWQINKTVEKNYYSRLWFVFVRLDIDNNLNPISYHICSSDTVAKRSKNFGKESRRAHTAANALRPKSKKIKRTSNSVNKRYFYDKENKFLNKWENLKLD